MTNGGRDGKLIGWRYLFLLFWVIYIQLNDSFGNDFQNNVDKINAVRRDYRAVRAAHVSRRLAPYFTT